MALQKFNCLNCEKEFEAGDWYCKDGSLHRVQSKIYYVIDAPADRRDCKNSRLMILNLIPERQETRGNDIVRVPGKHVEFVRGLYETDDPQYQIALDKRNNVFHGDEGRKLWENAYMSDAEKQQLDKIRLQGEVNRLQVERNQLLAEVQASKKKSA